MMKILCLELPHLYAQSIGLVLTWRSRYRQAFGLAPSFYRMQSCHSRGYLVEYMMRILCLELPHLYAQSITTEVKVKVEVDVKVEANVEVKIKV